jgi:putative component of toxin-antitoxin plasmid stabilization module
VRCRILFNETWQIAALCRGNKPLSLVEEFLDGLGANTRGEANKMVVLLERVSQEGTEVLPPERSKHIGGGVFEFRTKHLRVFYFKDGGKIILLCNGYIKQGQKADRSEKERAHNMKKEYETVKRNRSIQWETVQ